MGILLSIMSPAHAELVTTDQVLQRADASADRQELAEALKQDEVRGQLESMGVAPETAENRLRVLRTAKSLGSISGSTACRPAGRHQGSGSHCWCCLSS